MEINFFNKKAERFIGSTDRALRPRVAKAFALLEARGNNLQMPHSKALGDGLFELRIIGENQIRFVYTFHKNEAYVLHAFMKKTEQISQKDVEYPEAQLRALRAI